MSSLYTVMGVLIAGLSLTILAIRAGLHILDTKSTIGLALSFVGGVVLILAGLPLLSL